MDCKIITPQGLKINGSTQAYGGQLQSFSMSLSGLESQIKATVSLVGTSLTPPESGDLVVIEARNMVLNFQVGGYNLRASATGATTMELSLYDLSNILDNLHLVLREEVPEDGLTPDSVTVIGVKYGPVPEIPKNDEGKDYGIETAQATTTWGDVRAAYERETTWCEGETQEEKESRINDRVTSSTGKTTWIAAGPAYEDTWAGTTYHTLQSALGTLVEGDFVQGEFDFKGTYRDVIMQYCNAMGLQAWWDLEKNVANIAITRSEAEGFEKLSRIAASCDITSATTQVDFTTTFAKGAIGSFTSSNQGENSKDAGKEPSRYLKAYPIKPIFKIRKCSDDKEAMPLTEIDFTSSDVLKAIRATSHDTLWAAYALQSVVAEFEEPAEGQNKGASHEEIYNKIIPAAGKLCTKVVAAAATPDGVEKERDLEENEFANWKILLPPDTQPEYSPNKFLQNYFRPGDSSEAGGLDFKQCTAALACVAIGDLPPDPDIEGPDPPVPEDQKIGVPLLWSALNAAFEEKEPAEKGKVIKEKKKTEPPNGWNTETEQDPYKTLGYFVPELDVGGTFSLGKMFLKPPNYFDSILTNSGLNGATDILKMYLTALYNFKNNFWIVKEDTAECAATSVNVEGRSYGYYITSDAQKSPLQFDEQSDYELVALDPFAPLGQCECAPIKDLALALSLIYLKSETWIGEIMGWTDSSLVDSRNEETEIIDGVEVVNALDFPGVAVIDFIYALESSGENFKDFDQPKPGLEMLFAKEGWKAPTRPANWAFDDDPRLKMWVLTHKQGDGVMDLGTGGEWTFQTNPTQRENFGGDNKGQFEVEGQQNDPAIKLAEEMLINLGSTFSFKMTDPNNPLKEILSKQLDAEDPCDVDKYSPGYSLWGLKTHMMCGIADEDETLAEEADGETSTLLDLNGTIPKGYMDGTDSVFAGLPFITEAVITPEDALQPWIEVWYTVSGATNSFKSSESGEFTLTAMIPPATNSWTSKFDFGISVNAADIGRFNKQDTSWWANSMDMANSYSGGNRGIMHVALYRKLAQTAVTNDTIAKSDNITFLATGNDWEVPTIAEGLENFSISSSGGKTEVTLSVGNTRQREAAKAQYDRMIQFPQPQYRPASFMPSSWTTNASPKFQNFMRGIK
jgi:hypothetical protein